MNQVVTEFIEQWLEENEPPGLRQVVTDRTQPPPPTPDNGEASQTDPPKQGQRQMSKRGKGKEG